MSRAESQAQTRERLLEAARHEVIQKGFGGASVRDISEAAGYSQGAFYSNFESKETILLELLRQHMDEEAAQLREVLQRSAADGILALRELENWARSLNSEVDWSMLALELQLHAHRSQDFAKAYDPVHDAHAGTLGEIVRDFYSALRLEPQIDPRQLAAGFMALAHGLALQRRKDSDAPAGLLILTFLQALLAVARPVVPPSDGETP